MSYEPDNPADLSPGYTIDETFKMSTVSEPPSEPATPRDPRYKTVVTERMQELDRERENERQSAKTVDIRATAIELATRLWAAPNLEPNPGEDLFTIATNICRYIETGERPA